MREKQFQIFKEEVLMALPNDNWETGAYFYMCDSFHDVFVKIFRSIDLIEFKKDSLEEQNLDDFQGHGILTDEFRKLSKEERTALEITLHKIPRGHAARIATPRGNAFMIFGDFDYKEKREENTNCVMLYSNQPTGMGANLPRLIINQIAPKTYAILSLKNVMEVEFEINRSSFSFGVPCLDFPSYSGIGDIFFFKDTGLEFSRLNIVDIFNSHEDNIEFVGNKFERFNLKSLRISLFQENSFVYSVDVSEEAYYGYLRERHSEFKGTIDLRTNQWSSVEGSSLVASLR